MVQYKRRNTKSRKNDFRKDGEYPMVLKNKKALRLVVCMSLIAALAFTALGISVAATYENTHNNSGDQASDIVGIAQTQLGYSEGYDGYTKYGDWYGLPNSDWCAMFVSWCADQAGVDTSTFPKFALCSAGADWFISQGRFQYSGSYAPKAGDLIFYSSYGDIYHVGLVTGSDDSNVYSIEGNYCEAVYNVSYPLSYGDILGYATPDYTYADGATAAYEQTVVSTVEDQDEDEDENEDENTESEYEEDSASDEELYSDAEEAADTANETEYYEDTDSEEDETAVDTMTEEDSDEEAFFEEDTQIENDEDSDSEEANEAEKAEETFLRGDVNKDGKVTATDALYIQRYLVGANVDGFSFINADYNRDGEVNLYDALAILELVTGITA